MNTGRRKLLFRLAVSGLAAIACLLSSSCSNRPWNPVGAWEWDRFGTGHVPTPHTEITILIRPDHTWNFEGIEGQGTWKASGDELTLHAPDGLSIMFVQVQAATPSGDGADTTLHYDPGTDRLAWHVKTGFPRTPTTLYFKKAPDTP